MKGVGLNDIRINDTCLLHLHCSWFSCAVDVLQANISWKGAPPRCDGITYVLYHDISRTVCTDIG